MNKRPTHKSVINNLNDIIKNRSSILSILLLLGLVINGCNFQSEDTEGYLFGIVLSNIDDTTPEHYSFAEEDYGVYNFSYHFLGEGPAMYESILYFIFEEAFGAGSSYEFVHAPSQQTIYGYQQSSPVFGDFIFERRTFLDYPYIDDSYEAFNLNRESTSKYDLWTSGINITSGDYKEFIFGSDYTPPSILYSEYMNGGFIEIRNFLMPGVNIFRKMITYDYYYDIELENPSIFVYNQTDMLYSGNVTRSLSSNSDEKLLERWDKYFNTYIHHDEEEILTVNLLVPSHYPAFTLLNTTATINTSSVDSNPPYITNLRVPKIFAESDIFNITFEAYDDEENIEHIRVYFQEDDNEWILAETTEISANTYSASHEIIGAHSLNMQIYIEDIYRNSHTYVIHDIALTQKELEVEKTLQPNFIAPETNVILFGEIKTEDEVPLQSSFARLLVNNQLIKQAIIIPTEEGGIYNFSYTAPQIFDNNSDTIAIEIGGTGVYPLKRINLNEYFTQFETDVGILSVQTPNFQRHGEIVKYLYHGENEIHVTIANVGNTDVTDIPLNLYEKERHYYFAEYELVETVPISLQAGQTSTIPINFNYDGYGYPSLYLLELDISDDNQYNNNKEFEVRHYYAKKDAEIDILKPSRIIMGRDYNISVIVRNRGLEIIEDITWNVTAELFLLEYDGEGVEFVPTQPEILCYGEITQLNIEEEHVTKCEIRADVLGEIFIDARLYSDQDQFENNNQHVTFLEITSEYDASIGIDLPSYRPIGEPFEIDIWISNSGGQTLENVSWNVSLYNGNNEFQKVLCSGIVEKINIDTHNIQMCQTSIDEEGMHLIRGVVYSEKDENPLNDQHVRLINIIPLVNVTDYIITNNISEWRHAFTAHAFPQCVLRTTNCHEIIASYDRPGAYAQARFLRDTDPFLLERIEERYAYLTLGKKNDSYYYYSNRYIIWKTTNGLIILDSNVDSHPDGEIHELLDDLFTAYMNKHPSIIEPVRTYSHLEARLPLVYDETNVYTFRIGINHFLYPQSATLYLSNDTTNYTSYSMIEFVDFWNSVIPKLLPVTKLLPVC